MTQHRLKVAYVLKRFPRFSETFILNEILELERQGVDVEVFSLMHPPQENRHELLANIRASVTYLPQRGALSKWAVTTGVTEADQRESPVKALFEAGALPFAELFPAHDAGKASHLCLQAATLGMLASARGVQHMHAHFGSNATTVALLAGRLSGIPFSYTAHARDIYHTYVDPLTDDELRRHKIAAARFVVTVSDYNLDHLTRMCADSGGQIHRLYNGIDLTRFAPQPVRQQSKHFVAVGRLVEKKGFRYLVDACRILRHRGHQFRCTLVGDGPQQESLQDRIEEAGLAGYVDLPGPQPQEQLIQTLGTAAAVVLPCVVSESGDRDGLPTVLLEGLAMGLPAISTRVAGIPEIIDDGSNGFLVQPEESVGLAQAMEQILTQPELRVRLGRNARLKAERLFDLHRNVGTLRGLFEASVGDRQTLQEDSRDAHRLHQCG